MDSVPATRESVPRVCQVLLSPIPAALTLLFLEEVYQFHEGAGI